MINTIYERPYTVNMPVTIVKKVVSRLLTDYQASQNIVVDVCTSKAHRKQMDSTFSVPESLLILHKSVCNLIDDFDDGRLFK